MQNQARRSRVWSRRSAVLLASGVMGALAEAACGRKEDPAEQPAQDTVYIVHAGDCLWNLAKRFYGDPLQWKRIADANGLRDPYIILIGQSLRIPA